MKSSIVALASLMTLGMIAGTTPILAQPSEVAPGTPQQNDRRSPIAAKIDPSKPIQIRIVNQSSVEILAVLAEPTSRERKVLPQQSVTFGSLKSSFLPPPIDLTVYTNVNDTNLRARVTVVNNELIVTVTSRPGAFGITRSLEVDAKGAIYVY
ncbi:MAG: hypothetical protein MH252_18240 [Thermosynechococcaceae cyanobacterium MS004]|nr:hypothetical protein [Thermosynechococcaceae cyanobacterium MS004]